MRPQKILILLSLCCCFSVIPSLAEDGYDLWLRYHPIDNPDLVAQYQETIANIMIDGDSSTHKAIAEELTTAISGMLRKKITVSNEQISVGTLLIATSSNSPLIESANLHQSLSALGEDGFLIKSVKIDEKSCTIIAANTPVAALHGSFHFLRLLQTCQDVSALSITQRPKIQLRMLNHWDNLNGSQDRGYAGRSLWDWNQLPDNLEPRYKDYARACASIGINGSVLNNVNADPRFLRTDDLKKVAALASLFRPYGIKVYLSANFDCPLKPSATPESWKKWGGIGNLDTADPLNPKVARWWKDKADEIYRIIPDFGGFLVKANSEGMSGPDTYDRDHDDGANMLADALAPHGGVVMWRAFVHRGKRGGAYQDFTPLDGKFRENVFVQVKNGPADFQPREPVHPLFGAMPKTKLCAEVQITQEYLGFSNHLVYLAPMWKEFLASDTYAKGKNSEVFKVVDGTLGHRAMSAIAGVANTGTDRNWCGHHFAQANWYAFGRLAWDHQLTAEQIADEWIKMTFTHNKNAFNAIHAMMMGSREACVNYQQPLGLPMLCDSGHYNPDPKYRISRRTNQQGLGSDKAGSQYNPPLDQVYNDPQTCPEKLLLWFHRLPWDYVMGNGLTLWDELCRRYDAGCEYVENMDETWNSLGNVIDVERFEHVEQRLDIQVSHSKLWRDTCLNYFKEVNGRPIRSDRN